MSESPIGHNNPPNDMEQLIKLAREQYALEVIAASLEKQTEENTAAHKKISEQLLPELMESLEVDEYKTNDGISIVIEEKARGSLPKENKAQGYDWMEANGLGSVIKTKVVVEFTKKQLEEARVLFEELKERGLNASIERDVHHSTMDALVREQLAKGIDIPLDVFSVYRQRVAKVEV